MTMSNFEIYKQNEIRKLEIEVKALVALVNQEVNPSMRIDASKRLYQIAFPEKIEFDDAYERVMHREQTKL